MTGGDLAGKVCLITGAGGGIGAALACELARRGASVVLLDVDQGAAAAVAAGLDPGRALAIGADVRDRAAMRDAVAQACGRFGRLDVVVAGAGVTPRPATLRVMDPDDFDRVVAINLTGVFNTIHPSIGPVIEAQGHIVVVASMAATLPGPAGSPYMATKAAVESPGRSLRIELAPHGATAGVAYFGVVETPMAEVLDADPTGRALAAMLPPPLRRALTAADAANVVADGIERRAARTIAPRSWVPIGLLRGVLHLVVDTRSAADERVHRMVRELERRVLGG